MEVPRLGVELELQLPAYSTATATWDLSPVFNLHRSSWKRQILNPLSEARDRTCILMGINWVRNPLSHNGNSQENFQVWLVAWHCLSSDKGKLVRRFPLFLLYFPSCLPIFSVSLLTFWASRWRFLPTNTKNCAAPRPTRGQWHLMLQRQLERNHQY